MPTVKDPSKTCVCYCRVSTSKQKASETIEAQVERCERLVERHGLSVLPWGARGDKPTGYVMDKATSGTLLEARKFRQLLTAIESKAIAPDYIVVFSLSRISRIDKVSKDIDKLKASHRAAADIHAILIGTHTQVLDEEGPMDVGSLNFQLKSMIGNEGYARILAETSSGIRRRLREGKYAKGGRIPFGYASEPINGTDHKSGMKLARHPDHAEQAKTILRWYSEGGCVVAATKADAAGIPTPTKGDKWSPASVRYMVNNLSLYGHGDATIVYDGVAYPIQAPPLIDSKLRAAIERRTRERQLKRRATFVVTGFCDCACGVPVHVHNVHSTKHVVACSRGGRGRSCGNTPEEDFSAALWSATLVRSAQIVESKKTKPRTPESYAQAIKAAGEKLAGVHAQIDMVLSMYLAKEVDRETWERQRTNLTAAKSAAQGELERVKQEQNNADSKQARADDLYGELRKMLVAWTKPDVSLEVKRGALGKLLDGGRVIVTWAPKSEQATKPKATITFPAWGDLRPRMFIVGGAGEELADVTDVYGVDVDRPAERIGLGRRP